MIKVKLSGGVGNQLFQYFEGARNAIETNQRLILDFRDVYLGKSNHSSLINSFSLPVTAEYINVDPKPIWKYFGKIILSIRFKILRFAKLQKKDPLFETLRNQTRKNYDFVLSRTDVGLELKNPSPWFLSLSSEIQREPVIAIHIRRGDYLLPRNRNTIGVLDVSYYMECHKLANHDVGSLPVWIFSDSEDIDKEFESAFPPNTKFISPPSGSDPAESIMILSLARALIISNSTFSWWAAALSKNSTIVYCPLTWFKNLEQPRDLSMDSWKLVESKWKNYDAEE
jgi:hypothetical protein